MMRRNLFRDRRGTAEIVGTSLFLVILLFFFTNVFLWYDSSSRQSGAIMADKINSGVSLTRSPNWNPLSGTLPILRMTSLGGKDVQLIRVWYVDDSLNQHGYEDVEDIDVFLAGGSYIDIKFIRSEGDVANYNPFTLELTMTLPDQYSGEVMFKVITDLGNSAAIRMNDVPAP